MREEALVAARAQPGVDDRRWRQAAGAPDRWRRSARGPRGRRRRRAGRQRRRSVARTAAATSSAVDKAAGSDAGADDRHARHPWRRRPGPAHLTTPASMPRQPAWARPDGRRGRARLSGHEHRHAVGEAGYQGDASGHRHQTIGALYHAFGANVLPGPARPRRPPPRACRGPGRGPPARPRSDARALQSSSRLRKTAAGSSPTDETQVELRVWSARDAAGAGREGHSSVAVLGREQFEPVMQLRLQMWDRAQYRPGKSTVAAQSSAAPTVPENTPGSATITTSTSGSTYGE